MTTTQKIILTAAMWIAFLLISIVGVGWMEDSTAQQVMTWGSFAVALVVTLGLWMWRPASANGHHHDG